MCKEPDSRQSRLKTIQSERNLAHGSKGTFLAQVSAACRRMRQRRMVRLTNGESLLAMLRLVSRRGGIFARLKLHGNTAWRPLNLAWLGGGGGWAWSESLQCNRRIRAQLWNSAKTLQGASALSTYQGFMAAARSMDFTLHEDLLWLRASFQDRRNRGQVLAHRRLGSHCL